MKTLHSVSRIAIPILALCFTGALAVSAGATPKNTPAKKAGAKKAGAKKKQVGLDDYPLIARLNKPLESGPGVLVCEPVAKGVGEDAANFAAGCGRWLHLMVGGHGELGKTPLWTSVGRALRELKKPNTRLSFAEAVPLTHKLGITHAVIGQISGTEACLTLRYELWDLYKKTTVGEPVIIAGTREDIRAALPGAARRLATSMGVKQPRVPDGVGETTERMAFIGRIPFVPDRGIPPLDSANLQAAFFALKSSTPDTYSHAAVMGTFLALIWLSWTKQPELAGRMADKLLEILPDNALVAGEAGLQLHRAGKIGAKISAIGAVEKASNRFPNSFLIRIGLADLQRASGDLSLGRANVERAVRCSTKDPDAWASLGGVISEQADEIRNARTIDKMSEKELAACTRFYEDWLPACLKVVDLDHDDANGWGDVSEAAGFVGESRLADAALRMALQLDPTDTSALWWGLELYQPKWEDNRARLEAIAKQAVAAASALRTDQRMELAIHMQEAGLNEFAPQMLKTDAERTAFDRYLKQQR